MSVISPLIPPKTKGFPLIGSIPRLSRDFFGFLIDARKTYGEIYELDLGITNFYMFNHPDHAKHILVNNVTNFEKGDNPLLQASRELVGNGLTMSEGEFWKRQRRMMQPAFHREQMLKMTERMFTSVEEMLDAEWETVSTLGFPFDVSKAFGRITMKVVTRAVFGSDLDQYELELMVNSMSLVLDSMFRGMIVKALPNWLNIFSNKEYEDALQAVDKIIYDVIAQRRQNPTDDLISVLVHAVDDETNEQMTLEQLRDEVATLFLGGYDTTATALSWILHYVTQEPEIQREMQQEIDMVLNGRIPTYADLKNLSYIEMVFREALRLYPPVYWQVRNAGNAEVIDGYQIPAGASVAVATYVIHRHPEFWENPDVFDPERFNPERSANRHPYAWVPFGAGRHMCIGRDFAMIEAKYVLARLMQRYEITAVPGRVATARPSVLMSTKDGVWVYLKKRT